MLFYFLKEGFFLVEFIIFGMMRFWWEIAISKLSRIDINKDCEYVFGEIVVDNLGFSIFDAQHIGPASAVLNNSSYIDRSRSILKIKHKAKRILPHKSESYWDSNAYLCYWPL